MSVDLKVQLLREGAVAPQYQTGGAAGLDLSACLEKPVVLEAGKQAIVPTGIALEIPAGYEVQVRARSGLAAKYGIGLTNGVGTIDSDYRGEIAVILINWGKEPFEITNGMRIAQMVVAKYEHVTVVVAEELSKTKRGNNKFGSTGTHD